MAPGLQTEWKVYGVVLRVYSTTALVDALKQKLPDDAQIDVLTTLPNRYSSFSVEAPAEEITPGLSIVRIALPPHQSGMFDQAQAFLMFARGVLHQLLGRDYDLVYATSGRLMTAVLGAWVARKKRIVYSHALHTPTERPMRAFKSLLQRGMRLDPPVRQYSGSPCRSRPLHRPLQPRASPSVARLPDAPSGVP